MTSARIIFPEFRDEQSDSRYPFADDATLTTADGLTLNRDTFIDAAIYAINADAPVHISSITVDGAFVTITIGDKTTLAVCSTTYSALSPPASATLSLVDPRGRPAGILLSTKEQLAILGGWPEATHTFSRAATEFVASVVQPASAPGVRGLTLTDRPEFISGDIWLVGSRGVTLRQLEPNVIRVDIVGVPLFKRVLCLDDAQQPIFEPRPFLRTINGCGPDEFGNFNITVAAKNTPDSVLRIYSENDTLKITSVGSKVI
jgi:hypothetical protein